jgi:nondiscriminating aspartyl-tRNA synthetase
MKLIESIPAPFQDLDKIQGQAEAVIKGYIHKIRDMSEFAFILIRTANDVIQCVYSPKTCDFSLDTIKEGYCVEAFGHVVKDERAQTGFEIHLTGIKVLQASAQEMPIIINKQALNLSIDTKLNFRPLSLRNPKERAIFKIQEGILRGFREFLYKNDFTEIHSPKIVAVGAEGGANIFKLDYFGNKVFLAQSPQFYKQTMVGVFERVFEVGPVYRAEKHNTSRHLNEYISLDFEMGFIDGMDDIMKTETALLAHIVDFLKQEYKKELIMLKAVLPEINSIPNLTFMEAKEILISKFGRGKLNPWDLDPEDEQLLCKYAQSECGSELIFISHFPTAKRPFYAMDDAADPRFALSFDLLLRGLEITTGGQRIHDYNIQIEKMKKMGLNPDDFEPYLMIHKNGMPPHGGLGLGLERLTMKLLNLKNVRECSLFPRDITRITP